MSASAALPARCRHPSVAAGLLLLLLPALTGDGVLGAALEELLSLAADGNDLHAAAQLGQLPEPPLSLKREREEDHREGGRTASEKGGSSEARTDCVLLRER